MIDFDVLDDRRDAAKADAFGDTSRLRVTFGFPMRE